MTSINKTIKAQKLDADSALESAELKQAKALKNASQNSDVANAAQKSPMGKQIKAVVMKVMSLASNTSKSKLLNKTQPIVELEGLDNASVHSGESLLRSKFPGVDIEIIRSPPKPSKAGNTLERANSHFPKSKAPVNASRRTKTKMFIQETLEKESKDNREDTQSEIDNDGVSMLPDFDQETVIFEDEKLEEMEAEEEALGQAAHSIIDDADSEPAAPVNLRASNINDAVGKNKDVDDDDV